jgi:hypothetical protein
MMDFGYFVSILGKNRFVRSGYFSAVMWGFICTKRPSITRDIPELTFNTHKNVSF